LAGHPIIINTHVRMAQTLKACQYKTRLSLRTLKLNGEFHENALQAKEEKSLWVITSKDAIGVYDG
jgi:hypothetical protein